MSEQLGRLRLPVSVGWLVWSQVQDVLNDARAHGLAVEEYLSGRLVRSGWVVVTGRAMELARIAARFQELNGGDNNVRPPTRTGIEYLDYYLEQREHQRACGHGLISAWPSSPPQPQRSCIGCLTRGADFDDPCRRYAWAVPNPDALREIMGRSPNGVVEIGAGTGYWAMELRRAGADVMAYDLWPTWMPGPGNDRGPHSGKSWTDVQKAAHTIVAAHPDRTLLMCWPSYDEKWAAEAVELYQGDTIIYVGEGPGGCTADDRFHALIGERGGCWHTDDVGDEVPCPPDCVWESPPLFRETYQVVIPQWSGLHDRLTVHERIRADASTER